MANRDRREAVIFFSFLFFFHRDSQSDYWITEEQLTFANENNQVSFKMNISILFDIVQQERDRDISADYVCRALVSDCSFAMYTSLVS